MARLCTWTALVAVGLVVSGCYTDFGPVVTGQSVEIIDSAAPPRVASHIQAGDKIKLTVYGEDTLSGLYEISPSGTVSLPLIGTVNAVGRSRAELERAIASRYTTFVKDAKVTVNVIEFRPFYIMGEVNKPGRYPYESGLNVLTAISTAGGMTYRASKSAVLIQRPGEQVWQEFPLTASLLVGPGDLIRIPERYF
jgi:protein involved in polysaccharide export with SLBB domain